MKNELLFCPLGGAGEIGANKDRDFTLSGCAPFNPTSGKVPPAFGKSNAYQGGFGGGLNRTFKL